MRKINLITYSCFFVANVYAAQNIPTSVEPGRIDKPFIKAPIPESRPIAPSQSPKQIPPQKAEEISFVLKKITLKDNTIYSSELLQTIWDEKIGKEITIEQLYTDVADKITAKYRNDGWILSQAVIEAQDISNGEVTISIIEGSADQIFIEGELLNYQEIFEEYKRAIKSSKPLNNNILEKYSLLASELPGIKVKALIRASKTTKGTSDVIFVIERKEFDGSITFDNRGSKTIGPNQLSTNITLGAPFGLPDKIGFGATTTPSNTDELKYFYLNHERVLNSEGLKISTLISRNLSEPGGKLEDYEMKNKSESISPQISYPIIKTRGENLNSWIGINWQNSNGDILNSPNQRDKIRKIRTGLQYDFSDSIGGITMFNGELHKGISVLDATKQGEEFTSRADGGHNFTKATLEITRTQTINEEWSFMTGINGQIASHGLLSAEEFGFGGANYGRAYDSSEITGDNGIMAKTEISYTKKLNFEYVNHVQPYIFYDIGEVHNRNSSSESAASTGLGFRIGLLEYLNGQVELTKPLTRDVNSELPDKGDSSRIFFSLSGRY